MRKLQYQVTGYQCMIDLSLEEFKKLDAIDYLDVVMPALEELGASSIEYNGHFGAAVFFHTETLEEAQAVTEKIQELLK